jgi:hypothetical protein
MDTPLGRGKRHTIRSVHQSEPSVAEKAASQDHIPEPARDADTLMRTVIGSISFDPDEIERDLKKKAHHHSAAPERETNLRLVIFAVILVFLVFALDLVF